MQSVAVVGSISEVRLVSEDRAETATAPGTAIGPAAASSLSSVLNPRSFSFCRGHTAAAGSMSGGRVTEQWGLGFAGVRGGCRGARLQWFDMGGV